MRIFCLVPFLITTIFGFTQKPILDAKAINSWCFVTSGSICDNGGYIAYCVRTRNFSKLTVQSTNSDWKKEFFKGSDPQFVNDSIIVFKSGIDSLSVYYLQSDKTDILNRVIRYRIVNPGGLLICECSGLTKELILRNLITGQEETYSSVSDYRLNPGNSALLTINDSVSTQFLRLTDLRTKESRIFWNGINKKATAYGFDETGNQIAFTVNNGNQPGELWLFRKGMDSAQLLLNDDDFDLAGFTISGENPQFSKDGRKVFFRLQPVNKGKPDPVKASVEIWSYTDPQLPTIQMEEQKRASTFLAMFDLKTGATERIEKKNETVIARSDHYLLLSHQLGIRSMFEAFWNKEAQASYYLISLEGGTRKLLSLCGSNLMQVQLSPTGKWVIYYDLKKKNYFTYEVATGITRNVTKRIPTVWTNEEDDHPMPVLAGNVKWTRNDEAFLLGDTYDIWLIDPWTLKSPITITNGYGRKHRIRFEILDGTAWQDFSRKKNFKLLLKAINLQTEDWGFYQKTIGVIGNPELLNMGPYTYGLWTGHERISLPPIKAKDSDFYLVYRSSAKSAPNLFITQDFQTFKQLTNVEPQKRYNWYTTELHEWKSLDGTMLKGILYKPENFNPSKKYPVIFHYYEKLSDELNLFLLPGASEGSINIPVFVSKGYLVFVPDIHYKKGYPGRSAFNAIVSAARYLSQFYWIDTKRMGLQGYSFGGYETNYIVSKTSIFRAACSASGLSDLVSFYGSAARGGYPMYWAEKNQGRIGVSLYQQPQLYIEESPLFKVNKITTPLLMMSNKGDYVVPFSQGLELFTALRRLGKKAWMLQYDNGDHGVDGKDAEDFHIRLMQFFDHYLGGQPAPKWMTRGISLSLKGIEDGFEYDNDIKTPGVGLNAVQKE